MRNYLAAFAIVVTSFAASAAFGENAVSDSRARLAKLWNTAATQQFTINSVTRTKFAGMREAGRVAGTWVGNYRAGRIHPPSGH